MPKIIAKVNSNKVVFDVNMPFWNNFSCHLTIVDINDIDTPVYHVCLKFLAKL